MKVTAIILALIGLVALVFGYWGVYTPAGRLAYDEMDGIYPLASGAFGALLLVISVVLLIIHKLRY